LSEEPEEPKEEKAPESSLEQQLEEARKKAESYLDSWKRAQADFINYKRHAEHEKLEMGKYAAGQLVLALLPVLDDFERAYANLPPEVKSEWVAGIKLVESKMRSILESQGLKPIEAMGQPFDPALHEAMMHGNGPEGIVVGELRRGYKLYEKVLRASQVIVGSGENGGPKKEKEEKGKKHSPPSEKTEGVSE